MANTTGICDSFKRSILFGNINIQTATLKAALYLATATVNNSTATYTATGEASGANYTAAGNAVASGAISLDGNVAYWTPGASIQWFNVTLATAFDAVLMYNTGTAIANAIAVWNFGSTTVNNGTFTINMPSNTATTALIRLT